MGHKRDMVCTCGDKDQSESPRDCREECSHAETALCRLLPEGYVEPAVKHENAVSEEFAGRFCKCRGPYEANDTMVQCSTCLMWYHDVHTQRVSAF